MVFAKLIIISFLITLSLQEISRNELKVRDKNFTGATEADEGVVVVKEAIKKKSRSPYRFSYPFNKNESVEECRSSAEDFAQLFTEEERSNGAIILHFLVGAYCFTLIAIICDNYFLPCVEKICDALNLTEDVAGATFMAMATSAPELFINIIGTFISQSDVGLGTVVGAGAINVLGGASVGGLIAAAPIKMEWWPVCRDCFIYIIAVTTLVTITWDGTIRWFEAFGLIIGYFVYFTLMFQNTRISRKVYQWVDKFQNYRKMRNAPAVAPVYKPRTSGTSSDEKSVIEVTIISDPVNSNGHSNGIINADDIERQKAKAKETEYNIYKVPKGKWYKKAYYFYSFPIRFLLYWTVPDCRKFPKMFPITFVLCIVWMGCNSYVVSWMIAMIGLTFNIPDAVLGLTFMAVGGTLPETFSIAIMSKKGEGKLGISNALGSNTMNILLSLGMPWFIKTLVLGTSSGSYIEIDSGSLEYTILGLIVSTVILFTILAFNNFTLSKLTGTITLICYFIFLSLAIVADMVIFPSDCQ